MIAWQPSFYAKICFFMYLTAPAPPGSICTMVRARHLQPPIVMWHRRDGRRLLCYQHGRNADTGTRGLALCVPPCGHRLCHNKRACHVARRRPPAKACGAPLASQAQQHCPPVSQTPRQPSMHWRRSLMLSAVPSWRRTLSACILGSRPRCLVSLLLWQCSGPHC